MPPLLVYRQSDLKFRVYRQSDCCIGVVWKRREVAMNQELETKEVGRMVRIVPGTGLLSRVHSCVVF